ncbi:hypothetical protein BJX76DRAFT_57353 [Aspergillus varians]
MAWEKYVVPVRYSPLRFEHLAGRATNFRFLDQRPCSDFISLPTKPRRNSFSISSPSQLRTITPPLFLYPFGLFRFASFCPVVIHVERCISSSSSSNQDKVTFRRLREETRGQGHDRRFSLAVGRSGPGGRISPSCILGLNPGTFLDISSRITIKETKQSLNLILVGYFLALSSARITAIEKAISSLVTSIH